MKLDSWNVQAGDVVLFSYEKDDFISSMIAFLTDSSVSHAAMGYDVARHLIVEETPPQLSVNHADERFKGRTITVRRLKDETLSVEPLIDAANAHLQNAEPYSDCGLYLLGVVLIAKKFIPKVGQDETLTRLLELCCVVITTMLDKCKNPGKVPMTCSHFVSQCYTDAARATKNNKYELNAHNSALKKNGSPETLLELALSESVNILESVSEEVDSPEMTLEQLICEANQLAERYLEAEPASAMLTAWKPSAKLLKTVRQFARKLIRLFTNEKFDVPSTLIDFFANHKDMLVSPADLLQCQALETVAIIPEE